MNKRALRKIKQSFRRGERADLEAAMDFKKYVNRLKFADRVKIAWRVLMRRF